MLRYALFVKFEKVVKNADGSILHVEVSIVEKPEVKPKGYIHWVDAKSSFTVEVRIFDQLFDVDNAKSFGDDWLSHFNKDSLVTKSNAKWFSMYKDVKPYDRFQFQRLGFFVVSDESTPEKVVLFRTVTLTESKAKKTIDNLMKAKK